MSKQKQAELDRSPVNRSILFPQGRSNGDEEEGWEVGNVKGGCEKRKRKKQTFFISWLWGWGFSRPFSNLLGKMVPYRPAHHLCGHSSSSPQRGQHCHRLIVSGWTTAIIAQPAWQPRLPHYPTSILHLEAIVIFQKQATNLVISIHCFRIKSTFLIQA